MARLAFFFLLGLSNFLLADSKAPLTKQEKIRVTSVFFPTDNGLWTDKILSSFHKTLVSSPLDFQFTLVSYDFVKTVREDFLEEVAGTKPDYIFLPDDFLYQSFSEDLQKETGATILFTSLYQEKTKIKKTMKQTGVYCDAPVEKLFERAEEFLQKKVQSMLILGGPFAQEMAETLKKKAPSGVKEKVLITSSWEEYKKAAWKEALAGSVIFTLAPFGVKKAAGGLVKEKEFSDFLRGLKATSFGYGRIDSWLFRC